MADINRLRRQLAELRLFFNQNSVVIENWKYRTGVQPDHAAAGVDFDDSDWHACRPPLLWGGYDETVWFRAHLRLPKEFSGQQIALTVDLVDEHGEALLFVNGSPLQGIDRHHQEILLTRSAHAAEKLQFAIEAYAGRVQTPQRFVSASLVVPDKGVWDLYFALKNGLDALALLPNTHDQYLPLFNILQEAAQTVDWREPGSETFRDSAANAARRLLRALSRLRSEVPARLVPVGHAHIDVAWLWTLDEVQRKCGRTFATALHLMEQYPEYLFVQSQPQLYRYTHERYPELYEKIKKRVHEGRWEPVGGMWVEADCNIPSGESLVRQVIFGKRFFTEEFAVEVDNLWLPDVFGYSAALPQILKKAGIDYFFTAKIAWNDVNKFPYSTFWWQGIDGSRVFAHLTFLPSLYNSELTASDLQRAWDTFKQKGTGASSLLLSYGFGDGGGGPTAEHLENARILENMVGLPRLERKTVREFFQSAAREVKDLPVWWGELYLEYHRGTLTSQARNKLQNRKCELLLRETEFAQALTIVDNQTSAVHDLRPAWEKLLLNQFHDILPGSSIPEVYERSQRDYAQITQACEETIAANHRALLDAGQAQDSAVFAIFNSLCWLRQEPVEIVVANPPKEFTVVDHFAQEVASQQLERTKDQVRLLIEPEVPSTGYTVVQVVPEKPRRSSKGLKVSRREMENRWFRLTLNGDGQILSLLDKFAEREIIAAGAIGNVLETYEDMPAMWEAWDLDPDFEKKPLPLFRCKEIRVEEDGPLRGVVHCVHRSPDSTIIQRVMIYENVPRIDFDTTIDWHEKRVLLKVAFPVTIDSPRATYEIQYGSIERPTHTNTSWEAAKYEVVGHKWADLSEGNYGVSLLNDCKYGHDIRGNKMRLTLLRSPYAPDPVNAGHAVQHAMPVDQGTHRVVYALYPHAGDWRQALTVRRAYELNVPLRTIAVGPNWSGSMDRPVSGKRFVEFDHENLVMEVLKPADDGNGLIMRLYDSAGQRGKCAIRFDVPPQKVVVCNLLEENGDELKMENGLWSLQYSPFEIVTLRLVYK